MMSRLSLLWGACSFLFVNTACASADADDFLEEINRLTALKRVELSVAKKSLREADRSLASAKKQIRRKVAEVEEAVAARASLVRKDELVMRRAAVEVKKHILHTDHQTATFEAFTRRSFSSFEEYKTAAVGARQEMAAQELAYDQSLPSVAKKYKSPALLPEGAYRVALSIDGGGIKGLMPLTIMQSLEDFLGGKHLSDYVDCFGGTSIGGIVALGYAVRDDGDGPRYYSHDLRELFVERSSEVFPKKKGLGVLSSQYSPAGLEALLAEYFEDNTLEDVVKPVVVTALGIDKRGREFGTHEARRERRENYYLRDIARATSAAPTFFPAARIPNCGGDILGTYVDGGLYCNNPGLVTLSSMQKFYGDATDANSVVLSFGTGVNPREPWIARDAGAVGIVPILNGFMAGASDLVEHQLTDRLKDRHLRVQFALEKEIPLDSTDGFDLDLMTMSARMEETCVEPIARFLGENNDRRL